MQMDDKDKKVESTFADDDDDLNTTAPSSRPEAWKMPEPVFRRTSGKLPRGYEQNYVPSGTASAETVPENESDDRVAGSVETSSSTYVEPSPKHPTVKLVLVFLGLAAMIAFIVVFLTVVYFFFWRPAESSLP